MGFLQHAENNKKQDTSLDYYCDPDAAGMKQSLIGPLWPKEWTTIATVSSMVVTDDRARRESLSWVKNGTEVELKLS